MQHPQMSPGAAHARKQIISTQLPSFGTLFQIKIKMSNLDPAIGNLPDLPTHKHFSTVKPKDALKGSKDELDRSASGQRLQSLSAQSANEERVDQINAKLGFDKDYAWFKVTQSSTALSLGISRTNVTILNRNQTVVIGNYARSDFTVVSSTSNW